MNSKEGMKMKKKTKEKEKNSLFGSPLVPLIVS
jgi:hypothetical protein